MRHGKLSKHTRNGDPNPRIAKLQPHTHAHQLQSDQITWCFSYSSFSFNSTFLLHRSHFTNGELVEKYLQMYLEYTVAMANRAKKNHLTSMAQFTFSFSPSVRNQSFACNISAENIIERNVICAIRRGIWHNARCRSTFALNVLYAKYP